MPRVSVTQPVTRPAATPARKPRSASGTSRGNRASAVHPGHMRGSESTAVAQPQTVVRRVPSFWIYALLMVLAVYTAVTCVRQESELQTLRRAKAEIAQKIERETRVNEQLAERKLEIASGDAIERLAREKLGYVKDGERIFVDSNK